MKRILFLNICISVLLISCTEQNTQNKTIQNDKLIQAAKDGKLRELQNLLSDGADINAKRKTDGVTALLMASAKGYVPIVKLLLDKGADADAKRRTDGVTALLMASQNGHTEVVKLLLDEGADVNVKSTTDGVTALWIASSEGHPEVVKLLLDKGAVVNAKSTIYGMTALLVASQNGHTEVVKLLLDKGADVDATSSSVTALWVASKQGHTEVVKLLIAAGADVNAAATVVGKDCTPLSVAQNSEIKQLIQEAGDRQIPTNGTIHTYSNKERIAPLSIKTGGDKVDYFVKLTDWNTDTVVQTIFIRAGHTAETTVPLGSYRLKYAAGENWQGKDELFGDKTIYSKAEKRFDFTQKGNNVSGYSVELILQTGGNLSTVHIPKSEW